MALVCDFQGKIFGAEHLRNTHGVKKREMLNVEFKVLTLFLQPQHRLSSFGVSK